MSPFIYDSATESATETLGHALADILPAGSVVALNGTLGAGKTRLVRAIAERLGIDPRAVVSPTFVLVQEYHGHKTIYHIDAYRVRDEDEFASLGVEEYFGGANLVFIEWAERVARCLPHERVEIEIEVTGTDARRFAISSTGGGHAEALAKLKQALTK